MLENVRIYIPTRGRTDKKQQQTLKNLHQDLHKFVTLVCYPGEKEFHFKNFGNSIGEIIEVDHSHIGDLRQKCIDMSDTDIILFLDDNLDFHTRKESEKGTTTMYPLKGMIEKHFKKESIKNFQLEMFEWIAEKLRSEKYGMVGVSRRSDNCYHLDEEEKLNDRVCSMWGINRKIYNSLPNHPKFSDVSLKEDFYIILHFLTNGIPLISSYNFSYGKPSGANSKGGCSLYRKIEASNESAHILFKHFPEFVTVTEKGTKSWGGEFGETALDVRVNWKKAYEYGLRNRSNS